jgi:FkbM family methyltransferase
MRLKIAFYDFISIRAVNWIIRALLGPMRSILPFWMLKRLRAAGKLTIHIPGLNGFTIDTRDLPEADSLYWNPESYEPGSIKVALHILGRSRTVLDIGAHRGLYTLVFSSHPGVTTVHAFEPNPQTFHYLCKNVKANKLKYVHLNQIALSNFDGTITLYVPNNSTTPLDASTLSSFRTDHSEITVPCMTVSSYVQQYHSRRSLEEKYD